jgi:hypothetical protein
MISGSEYIDPSPIVSRTNQNKKNVRLRVTALLFQDILKFFRLQVLSGKCKVLVVLSSGGASIIQIQVCALCVERMSTTTDSSLVLSCQ